MRYLVVPGALRSLAPLPVTVPLPIHGPDGRPLNDPLWPYWGRYEEEEDTRRKPAYHNGTAWTWTFPVFCEALARAWDFAPEAVAAAKAYLGSMAQLLQEGWPDPQSRKIDPAAKTPAPAGRGWPVVGLDVGSLGHGFGKQAEIKFQ